MRSSWSNSFFGLCGTDAVAKPARRVDSHVTMKTTSTASGSRSCFTPSQHRISSSSIRSSYLKSSRWRISKEAPNKASYNTSDWEKAMTSRHKRAHLLKTGGSVESSSGRLCWIDATCTASLQTTLSDARPPFSDEQALTNAESPSTRYCLARAFSPYRAHWSACAPIHRLARWANACKAARGRSD